MVIGEQIKLTLRRVLPKHSLRFRSASTAANALAGNRFLLHARSAASVSPTLAVMALLSSAPSYTTGLAPSPAKGNARCAASLDIDQEYRRRSLHQRLLKSPSRLRHNVDIDLDEITHDVLEVAFAEIACSPNASAMCSHQPPVPGLAGHSTA